MSHLPAGAAEEVLRRYADLLRVGRLTVDGRVACWKTDTSSELQLESFCETVVGRLRELLPDLAQRNPSVMRLAAYWILKAVSINYALIEVVLMVRRRVGVLCSIETREHGGGALVEYGIDVRPGPSLRVSLTWRKGNNIVYRDPKTAHMKVKGSLSRLVTEFRLPPEPGSIPEYRLDLRLRKSLAASMVAKLACACPAAEAGHSLCLTEPLNSEALLNLNLNLNLHCHTSPSLEGEGAGAGAVSGPVHSGPDRGRERERSTCAAFEGAPLLLEDTDATPSTSPSNTASTEEGDACEAEVPETWGSGDSEEALVGRLRVRVLRAGLDDVLRPGARWAKPLLYVSCSVAGRTERSRLVPSCSSPEWLEGWDFPLRARDLRGELHAELFGLDAQHGDLELLGSVTTLVSLALTGAGAVTVSEHLRGVSSGFLELELEALPDAGVATDRGPGTHGPQVPQVLGEPALQVQAPRSVALEDLSLRVQVRAAAPRPNTCGLWCSRGIPCTAECG